MSSLKYFHDAFYSYCKRIYPAECLFEHCCRGYALYIQGLVVDSSSSEDEAGGYAMKKEEDLLSSSNSILQQEIFQNSDIKVDDSIIEQKSSSLEIDQNAPFYDEDIEVLDWDQHQPVHSEDMPIYDEYSDEEEKIPTSPFVDFRSNQRMYDN